MTLQTDLTAEAKAFARQQLATVAGVAPVERFAGAPLGHRPDDLLPGARSVVVMGVRLLDAVSDWRKLLSKSTMIPPAERVMVAESHFYGRSGYATMNARLEQLGLLMALFLEERGHKSLYFPATWADHAKIMEKVPGYFAPFSHRHAAVLAGLGEFGLSNLVVTPRFGPRMRFMSVITRAELEPDPLVTEKLCRGLSCARCVRLCGEKCITPLPDLDDRQFFIDMPSVVDKPGCYFKASGHHCWGLCIAVCPVGREE